MNRVVSLSVMMCVVFFACKSRKKVTPQVVVPPTDSAMAVATAESILSFTLKDWKYFSSKIDIDYRNGDDKKSITANIRMLKDSLVWISAGLFGIEGARILINKDSVVLMDRINKKYSVFRNEAISGFSDVPLTVTQVQNLIIAKPVFALKLYEITVNTDAVFGIDYEQEKFVTSHRYVKQFFTIDTTMIRDRTTPNFAMAKYQDYSVVNGHNFPMTSHVTATNGGKQVELDLKFQDVDFETEINFPFNIPSSFEKTR